MDAKTYEEIRNSKLTHLPEGTPIVITLDGVDYPGIVMTANNHFLFQADLSDDWFIEFHHGADGSGRYGYWKQSQDGGELTILEDADPGDLERSAGLNRGRP